MAAYSAYDEAMTLGPPHKLHLSLNDCVATKADPIHRGKVVACYQKRLVKVDWDSGCSEFVKIDKLRLIPRIAASR